MRRLQLHRPLRRENKTLTEGGLRFPVSAHGRLVCTCEEVVVEVSPWRRGVVRIEGEDEVVVKLREVAEEGEGGKIRPNVNCWISQYVNLKECVCVCVTQ